MSASIYYQPVKHGYLTGGNGVDRELKKVFGDLPMEFSSEHVPQLRVLAVLWNGDELVNPYEKLIQLIDDFGLVRVWVEF